MIEFTNLRDSSFAAQSSRVLVAGELNPDLIFSQLTAFPRPGQEVLARDFALQLGSSSAIFAAGLARLGTPVSFCAKIGDDSFGRFCAAQLAGAGVDMAPVIVDPALQTGLTVSISAADRALLTYSGAIAELHAADVSDGLLAQYRHLHVSSYYLQAGLRPGLGELFARARALGLTVSLDPGCDPEGQWGSDVVELLTGVDVFLVNEVELAALSGFEDVGKGLDALSNTRTLIVAKLGARGCAVRDEAGLRRAPALPVAAVDTTGAGDSFNAGFIHAWLRGMPVAECLRSGTICGGLSTRALGGTASQPDWGEVMAHWNTQGEAASSLERAR